MLLTLIDGGEVPGEVLALAHASGRTVQAVAFVPDPAGSADTESGALADTLAAHGVETLHLVRHGSLDGATAQTFGDALAQVIEQLGPEAVFAPGGDTVSDVLAHAAARLRLPLATNCVSVTAPDRSGPWRLTRTRAGGVLLEDAELAAATALLTVAPGATTDAPAPGPVAACAVREIVPDLPEDSGAGRVVERTRAAGGVTLASAPVVVSGGRGVGGADGYAVLEELAGLLGGAVGCSRVATNNGWRPHSDQVGLTGTKVACDLYLACGISGATQHWVGCMDSRTILAVNTDPEAPLVSRADYAVIGDVHEVLPAVVAELRARREQRAGREEERVLTRG